jgi:hypothetical protein
MRWRAFDKGLIRGHCTSSTEAILSVLVRRHEVTNAQSADRDPLLIASVWRRRLTNSINLTALSFGRDWSEFGFSLALSLLVPKMLQIRRLFH